jgi:hypothetical protein
MSDHNEYETAIGYAYNPPSTGVCRVDGSKVDLILTHGKRYSVGSMIDTAYEQGLIAGQKQPLDRIKELEARLGVAVGFLKQAKAQFAPSTTNSDVDLFLAEFQEEWERLR